MRRWLPLVLLAGCGEPTLAPSPDAPPAIDAPPDPFADRFDDPSDFPRRNCTPGSLAGFARSDVWYDLGLRIQAGAPLETFMAEGFDEVAVPNLHTADDLIVRRSVFYGTGWGLVAIDVCGADPDGTLRGTIVYCTEGAPGDPCATQIDFTAAPFRRFAGEPEAAHLVLRGELGRDWPGSTSDVKVDGDLAFLSRFGDGLRIVSVANPAAPVELAHFRLPAEFANDLAVLRTGGRRYVVVASVTTNVIDVTQPSSPQLVTQLPFGAHSVTLEGTTAYLVDGYSGRVQIWDLATPSAPRELGTWEHPDPFVSWHDVFVAGGIAYLSDISGSGLHVVDLRAPSAPQLLGGEDEPFGPMWHSPWLTTVAGRAIAIDGTEFSEPGMRFLDGDPASPTFLAPLGEWSLGRGSAHNLVAIGSRVYVALYRDGVRVLDIADPAAPVDLGHFHTWPLDNAGATAGDFGVFGIDLDPARRRIYVADSIRGLVILEGDATIFP